MAFRSRFVAIAHDTAIRKRHGILSGHRIWRRMLSRLDVRELYERGKAPDRSFFQRSELQSQEKARQPKRDSRSDAGSVRIVARKQSTRAYKRLTGLVDARNVKLGRAAR